MNNTKLENRTISMFETMEMFQKETTIQRIVEYAQEHLYELMGGEGSVEIDHVLKNNGQNLTSITYRWKGINIAPTVYADNYVGLEPKDAVEMIAKLLKAYAPKESVDCSMFTDKEYVKKHAYIRMVNYELNKDMLENMPYRKVWGDLAAYVVINVGNEGSIKVGNTHLDAIGMEADELIETAIRNARCDIHVRSIGDVVKGMVPPEARDDDPIYDLPMKVVSNKKGTYGSGCILGDMEMFGDDYYIIPSSVNELIVLTDAEALPIAEVLNDMISEVNRTTVSPQDVLSDHKYHVVNGKVMEGEF